jgi:hypothetical protein
MDPMGSFLDHLQDAERERRSLRVREQRERAEIHVEYVKRQAARPYQSVIRSSTPRPGQTPEGS